VVAVVIPCSLTSLQAIRNRIRVAQDRLRNHDITGSQVALNKVEESLVQMIERRVSGTPTSQQASQQKIDVSGFRKRQKPIANKSKRTSQRCGRSEDETPGPMESSMRRVIDKVNRK
jgi:hypothetical protein